MVCIRVCVSLLLVHIHHEQSIIIFSLVHSSVVVLICNIFMALVFSLA